ncbi:MAG: hypothetical protein LIO87_06735, partial [Eubacterium sp.]|nr:hypothetical protein [Eubacterium sp.]
MQIFIQNILRLTQKRLRRAANINCIEYTTNRLEAPWYIAYINYPIGSFVLGAFIKLAGQEAVVDRDRQLFGYNEW